MKTIEPIDCAGMRGAQMQALKDRSMTLGKVPYWDNLNAPESDFYAAFLKKSRKWASWINTKPEKRVGEAPPEPTNEEYLQSGALWWKLFGRDNRVS